MWRANMILLVLMGGGMTLWVARPSAECRDARARNAPTADTICRSSSWTSHPGGGSWVGHSTGSWFGGSGRSASSGGTTGSTSSFASVVRGGFGAFHASFGS
jgi:hypothetical protein